MKEHRRGLVVIGVLMFYTSSGGRVLRVIHGSTTRGVGRLNSSVRPQRTRRGR